MRRKVFFQCMFLFSTCLILNSFLPVRRIWTPFKRWHQLLKINYAFTQAELWPVTNILDEVRSSYSKRAVRVCCYKMQVPKLSFLACHTTLHPVRSSWSPTCQWTCKIVGEAPCTSCTIKLPSCFWLRRPFLLPASMKQQQTNLLVNRTNQSIQQLTSVRKHFLKTKNKK